MWVTWSPFATTTWADLCTAGRVRNSVLNRAARCLQLSGERDAALDPAIDDAVCDLVASRLWIIVLSERQERHLVLAPEHQALIRGHVAAEAARR